MCTVTLIPYAGGLRAVCSRDEQRSRPPAIPPTCIDVAGWRALMPIDPASAGTWIAVNSAGVLMVLLNANPETPPSAHPVQMLSRGGIIPSLIGAACVDDAVRAAAMMPVHRFAPFRLVMAEAGAIVELRSRGGSMSVGQTWHGARAAFFTSSGLGDALVEAPRRRLFDETFVDGKQTAARQDFFHEHRWPMRPHLSIFMERADARTVSWTTVELQAGEATMSYREVDSACVTHQRKLSLGKHEAVER